MTALSSMECLVVLMAQAISTPTRDTWKVSVSQNKNAILIDTGPVVALIDQNDFYHEPCDAVAKTLAGPVLTCLPVLTEACYMLGRVSPQLIRQLHLAERERIDRVFTIDRKDFSVYRTQAGKSLTLLPKDHREAVH